MKILYMGTPDFAVLPLEKLISAGHEIVGVITREDKPKGRGMKVLMTPVKECALTHNIYFPSYPPSLLRWSPMERFFQNIFWIFRNTDA